LGDGKCVHVIISDGDLQQELKVSRVKSYFKEIAGRKDRGVVFVEIKDSGVFGDFMRGLARRPNVYFMHVDEIEEISNLKEILIRYERVSKFYA
jgi:Mg-chelatase subunit ChlD